MTASESFFSFGVIAFVFHVGVAKANKSYFAVLTSSYRELLTTLYVTFGLVVPLKNFTSYAYCHKTRPSKLIVPN